MQTYMLKHLAEESLSRFAEADPSIRFEIAEGIGGGGFIIQAIKPAHIEWSDEIISSLTANGVDIVTDTEHTTPTEPTNEATAPVETTAAADAAPATEKPKKEPKPKVQWSVMWKTAPDKVAARVAKGEAPFKPGSKRDITRQLLEQENGCTLEEAMTALGWDKPTVLSSFTEIATLMPTPDGKPGRRKVVTTKGVEGQPSRYSMGPPMTESDLESERKARGERRVQLAEEKKTKAAERDRKKAEAEAAAKAATEAQQSAAGQHTQAPQHQTDHVAAQ
jgi:hypothetical protein